MVKEVKQKKETKTIQKDNSKKEYVHAVGRRREAVARVRLYPEKKDSIMWGESTVEKGTIFVNGKVISEYFPSNVAKMKYEEPLLVAGVLGKFTVTIAVSGGGKSGQLDAVVHGIARVLSAYDREHFRSALKKKGLLTRDARAKERRKVGTGGKARRKKQSPKR